MLSVTPRQVLTTFVPAISMLAVIAVISLAYNISMPLITRDVTAIGKIHPLSGFLSSMGIFLWCVAASICCFAAIVLHATRQKKTFWFLLCSSLLSAYLMFDDAFLFHESLASTYFGLDEKIIILTLAVMVFTYLVMFRDVILTTNYSILVMALGFLSFSVVVDIVLGSRFLHLGEWEFFVEDGLKWLGIASWCSYYTHTSYCAIKQNYAGSSLQTE